MKKGICLLALGICALMAVACILLQATAIKAHIPKERDMLTCFRYMCFNGGGLQ